jgi:hypothetical protein
MSARKFIWTVNQLRFYPYFSYLKIRKNSQDFAKKLHFHKNYCSEFVYLNCDIDILNFEIKKAKIKRLKKN